MIEGYRQGSKLLCSIDDSQIYCKNKRLLSGQTTYICRIKTCNARVYLSEFGDRVSSRPEINIHNHGNQSDELKKMIVCSEIKKRCTQSTEQSSDQKQIFNDVMAE